MDRIMPIDLDNARLRTSLRGYNRTDVDELLTATAASLEIAIADNAALREQNERLRADLDILRQQEGLIKEALVAAQRAADDLRANAQRHAELMLEEGRQAALAERIAVQQRVSEMRWELEKLTADRQRFADDFQALLARYQRDTAPPPALMMQAAVGA